MAKCVEAEIMDWADDITYAVHDLIDFFCAGQIPLDRLANEGNLDEAMWAPEQGQFFSKVFQHIRGESKTASDYKLHLARSSPTSPWTNDTQAHTGSVAICLNSAQSRFHDM